MKKLNKKGFTLAELLVVVAIIAVLTAIAIPVFSSQLKKANDAVDVANVRAAYAEIMVAKLADGNGSKTVNVTFVGDGSTDTWTNGKIGTLSPGTHPGKGAHSVSITWENDQPKALAYGAAS